MDGAKSKVGSERGVRGPRAPVQRRERQIVRVLSLLRTLSQNGRASVRELAVQFGTRRETIYRDLRVLQDAGYPVGGDEQGRLSHPRLVPSPVPSIRFSAPELEALQLAAEQMQVGLPSLRTLEAARGKLKALLDSEPDGQLLIGREILESWGCGTKDYREHEAHIEQVVEAILRRRRCRVVYAKPSGEIPKNYTFDPYRLLLVNGGLYVLGRVPKYEDVATLSLDRFVSIAFTSTCFEVTSAFDPKKYREQAFGVSWQDPEEIVLRFRADQAPYVRERVWHPSQRLTPLANGGLEMVFHAGGRFEIRRWILGWGDAVEVISPGSLREELAQVARCTAYLYREG